MRKITFDLDVLRTFVTGVELGSFAKAADRLGRSTSAVSAQLKKLEDQLDAPVLRKAGRGMEPTPAGETLLAYARRLLELNDEAVTALRGADLAGTVRLGMQQDFGEHLLTEVLGRFARAHAQVSIEARVGRNAQLIEQVGAGQRQIELAIPHLFDQLRVAPDPCLDADLRVRAGEAAQHLGEQMFAEVLLHAKPNGARQVGAAQRRHRLVVQIEQAARIGQQGLARRRELHAAPGLA